MVFAEVFERFVKSCPACVMHRALMDNIFAPAKLDALFRESAQIQYERELLFSTMVDLVSQVVCRSSKSVHAAYVRQRERISVSLSALYKKLARVEPRTARALVHHSASEARELVDRCGGRRTPLLKGFQVRILDGNHLGKTDHRLEVLRGTSAGALPGQTLVVLDPERMLIDTRLHGRMPWEPAGKSRRVGRCTTGAVYEQNILLRHRETGKTTYVRRITVKLVTPTRDGDTELHILTNLTVKQLSAVKVAEMYRRRWTLEQAFNELTMHLNCELSTLGYPKAALFAFSVAVCSYNLLAAVKGALRGIHGEEIMETKVSNFFLTDEINANYGGMMIAFPPDEWLEFQALRPAAMARQLHRWALMADLNNYPKQPHGPPKPKAKLPNSQFQHVSTAKLLAEEQMSQQLNPKSRGP
jgi:hypothetical protein